MRVDDIKTFADLGKAFWVDPSRSRRLTAETLSAISLLDLTPDRAVEKAASALLDRAMNEGMAGNARANLEAIHQPFYRLFPQERFILVALHLGRWSYARLGRILNESAEEIERMAWAARLQLAPKVTYPVGSQLNGSCPEYEKDRPWTQKFLDEEIPTGRERLFLQNHLMACDSCRQALNLCRDVYYSVEKMIPRLEGGQDFIANLERMCRQGVVTKAPSERSFRETLVIFFGRWDVQLAFSAFIVLILYRMCRFFR